LLLRDGEDAGAELRDGELSERGELLGVSRIGLSERGRVVGSDAVAGFLSREGAVVGATWFLPP